jgi:hypothetical protein
MRSSARRVHPVLLAALVLATTVACVRTQPPPPAPTTTTAPGHDHGPVTPDAPYISADDPRLTPAQQQRAKDLIARTRAAMRAFPDQASVVRAGYVSILDANSGHEHFFNHPYMNDGRVLDPNRIESIVFETRPGQPKRVVAAMYMLDVGSTFADVPEVAGPLTPWHNHKDLCWDPSFKYVVGVFRLGRCIPLGTVRELPPMLHVWIVDGPCGPFAEVDDTNGIVDRYLRSAGLLPPQEPTDACAHVHGGDHATAPPG